MEKFLSSFHKKILPRIKSGENIFEILNEILDELLRICSTNLGNISFTDPYEKVLTIIASRGLDTEKQLAVKLPFNIGVTGNCAGLRKTIYVQDVSLDKYYVKLLDSVKSELAVPLLSGEDVIGVINLESENVNHFTKNQIRFIEEIAVPLADAVVQNRNYKEYFFKIHEEIDILNRIIGYDPKILQIKTGIRLIGASDATVLIQGESGSGKELVAQSLHFHSPRKGRPFISMNCAALNENLLESELFGHVKGAFTGAERNYTGRFEAANGGTLFLDEVSEMPPSLQVKLLRVIQEREIEKVGDHKKIKIDIRIISATHRNLRKDAEDGRFRSDLFYRLAVVPIFLPSLKERKGDIPLLAHHFLNIFNQKYSRNRQFSEEFIESICAYHWPGNVRELQNVIEYSALVSPTDQISLDSIPDSMKEKNDFPEKEQKEKTQFKDLNLDRAVMKLEAEYIERALEIGKSQDEASKLLQISRGSLQYKLKNNPHLSHLYRRKN